MSARDGRTDPVSETVAGLTAGVISTLVSHPFDLVKTRLQVDRVRTSGLGQTAHIIKDIVRHEGSGKAFYRGLTPNIVGNAASWGLYFLWYGQIKNALLQTHGGGATQGLSFADYFLASTTAGALTALCTNPIWVVKTRMLSTGSRAPGAYQSMSEGVKIIFQREGVRGFYRGLVPALFGVSHGGVQFMAYEKLKIYRADMKLQRGQSTLNQGNKSISSSPSPLSNLDFFFISALSKAIAGSVTYPYQVLRARLQMYDAGTTYSSVTDAIRQIWRNEGVRGYYKGLAPNIIRVLPSTCVTFLVYENTRIYWRDHFSGGSSTTVDKQ
ncbi:mitochondrial carrier [Xylona heveae TC161]|uniref:Mitochondrial carrier n=1 Tax=Xylona heveae (strain CBS 132557 / TC161) TaxID=1328760 RepID=A0A165FR16_XYLHT|nr:mitochondrial carrier [Xylona heveae TC161]KZF21274.1 mitochondrial carrier [Xylona heveae TC161]